MYFKYSTKSETREYEVNCTTDCPMQKKSKTTQMIFFVDETVVLHENNNLIAELNETIKSIQNLHELKKSDNVMNDFLYLGKKQKKKAREVGYAI